MNKSKEDKTNILKRTDPAPPSGGWGVYPHLLHFKQPAGTSRGIYTTRKVWYITPQPPKGGVKNKCIEDKTNILKKTDPCPPFRGLGGILGECAPLPNLSCDDLPDEIYESILIDACRQWEETGSIDHEALRPYPSILFGLECMERSLQKGSYRLWDTPFSRGEQGIPINGLIWMGNRETMLKQIESKLEAGFRCIKLKIGAINFEEELSLLQHIRKHFSVNEVELRVDANGAFTPEEAMEKLNRLRTLEIHSIEQPIRAGQWEEMAQLTEHTPLPIALDEELIGINQPEEKVKLLDTIRPQYIILKPSLHGGFSGSEEWIKEAEKRGIAWWITSALESNIGLNAIAQWCATFNNPLPQGLGTGALFTNNIEMPITIRKNCLWYDPQKERDLLLIPDPSAINY